MFKYPAIHIKPPGKNSTSGYWGKFIYGPEMPNGPWRLTLKPKELVRFKHITVLECFASEFVDDDDEKTYLWPDPCFRNFLIGRPTNGNILWWHNLGYPSYDLMNQRSRVPAIVIEGKKVIVRGYGAEPDTEIHIDIETGVKVPESKNV